MRAQQGSKVNGEDYELIKDRRCVGTEDRAPRALNARCTCIRAEYSATCRLHYNRADTGEFERLAAGHGLRPGARAAHIAGLPAGYAIDGAALLIELTAESEECSPAACLGLEYQASAITGFLMKGTTAVR